MCTQKKMQIPLLKIDIPENRIKIKITYLDQLTKTLTIDNNRFTREIKYLV